MYSPIGYDKTFNWNSYLSTCKGTRAPENNFTKQQMAKVTNKSCSNVYVCCES